MVYQLIYINLHILNAMQSRNIGGRRICRPFVLKHCKNRTLRVWKDPVTEFPTIPVEWGWWNSTPTGLPWFLLPGIQNECQPHPVLSQLSFVGIKLPLGQVDEKDSIQSVLRGYISRHSFRQYYSLLPIEAIFCLIQIHQILNDIIRVAKVRNVLSMELQLMVCIYVALAPKNILKALCLTIRVLISFVYHKVLLQSRAASASARYMSLTALFSFTVMADWMPIVWE